MKTDLLDLRLMDCMELMKEYPDNHFDLAVVDPPYGLGEGQKRVNQRSIATKKWPTAKAPQYGGGEWDNERPKENYFYELKRVSKNQIVWGANHFLDYLEPSSCAICWHKKRHDEKNDFSDFELAIGSFKTGARLFHLPWIGFGAINEGVKRIHPTEKPVKLYAWIFANYAEKGQKVLDTHMGSGSIAIAAHYAGMNLTACELDPDYYKAACERIDRETAQLSFL
tara:strand:+ start:54 stop:728 length:675 start_codon:yes stop_codon:yes gene_type:complete